MPDLLADSVFAALPEAARDLGDDRLAFLALTSKPELQVRDALAWTLYQQLDADLVVSREWKRTDLAIVDSEGAPRLLLEAKAMTTFDVVSHKTLDKFMGYLASDYAKATQLAQDGTAIILLLLVTHIADPVPGSLSSVVKYSPAINASLRRRPATELQTQARTILIGELQQFDQHVREVALTNGVAFGIRCGVTGYLIG